MSDDDRWGRAIGAGPVSSWMEFLGARARLLREWDREGRLPEESARDLSMDPGQVRLILATPRHHANDCEAEADHPHDCATATRLAQLTALAQDVVNEVECPSCGGCAGVDPCLHCAAEQALEPPR
jgi:hypothetical protein